MLALFCILIPSIISMRIEWHLLKKDEKRILYLISNYLIYCFFNNVLSCCFIKLIFDHYVDIYTNLNLYTGIMIEYATIALVISIILAFIKVILIRDMKPVDERTKKK